MKIAKNALFLHIFGRDLANHPLVFFAFGRKTKFIENSEKTFENFLKKICKTLFSIFLKET